MRAFLVSEAGVKQVKQTWLRAAPDCTKHNRLCVGGAGVQAIQRHQTCRCCCTDTMIRHVSQIKQRTRTVSCKAQPSEAHVASLNASGKKFGLVVARFNDIVTKLLLEGALDAFRRHGNAEVKVFWVPGSFELPIVAKSLAKGGSFDAVMTIGAVIRGATTHYEAVVNSSVSGTLGASLDTGIPVIFGVLTTETMEQAMDRAGGKAGNKGYECAVTAIEMANLMEDIKAQKLGSTKWGVE